MTPTHTANRASQMTRGQIGFLGVLVGIGIVGGFAAYRQLVEQRLAHATAVAERSRQIARLRSENDRLSRREQEHPIAEESTPTIQSEGSSPDSMPGARAARNSALLSLARILNRGSGESTHLRLMARLRTQNQIAALTARGSIRPPMGTPPDRPAYLVGLDCRLPPHFGELFDIGADEVARLQQVLISTRERVDELTAANATMRDQGDGNYVLDVRALSDDQIAADRDRMIATFKAVLGEDGYRAFAIFNGESQPPNARPGGPNEFFHSFGTSGHTVTVSKGARGEYRYEMQRDIGGRASGMALTLEDLRDQVGGEIKLLPAGF
jgi:hypothetical protein